MIRFILFSENIILINNLTLKCQCMKKFLFTYKITLKCICGNCEMTRRAWFWHVDNKYINIELIQ